MKESVIQFGSGNFLRAFFCPFVQKMREQQLFDGHIVIVQPTKGGKAALLNARNGNYNVFLRGIENGEAQCEHIAIDCVSRGIDPYADFASFLQLAENPDQRFIVSNTTEAGIVFDATCRPEDRPALSFPGKLTQLLYHRYKLHLPGFVILACELIDNNGDALRNCVLQYARLWELENGFCEWVKNENHFCNTLVDRIVTGFPQEEVQPFYDMIGYEDKLLVTAERFGLWVIEGDFENELPLQKAGLPVVWTADVAPYKKMKVRILNGAHTSLVFASLLCDVSTVRESLHDELLKTYLERCLFGAVLPVLGETDETRSFAEAVLERFDNPFICHRWQAISLNSTGKFRVRILPAIRDFEESHNTLPEALYFALACLIHYYKTRPVNDDPYAVSCIRNGTLNEILCNESLWEADLSHAADFVGLCLTQITENGIREALQWIINRSARQTM